MLWGAGTVLGEIPPYAVAYHASVASGKVSGMEEALEVRSLQLLYNAEHVELLVSARFRQVPGTALRTTRRVTSDRVSGTQDALAVRSLFPVHSASPDCAHRFLQ